MVVEEVEDVETGAEMCQKKCLAPHQHLTSGNLRLPKSETARTQEPP
jgi:hypothetical protein